MISYKRTRPTIGLIIGWQVYWSVVPIGIIGQLLRGIQTAARDHHSNLLLACGFGLLSAPIGDVHPAWPVPSATNDFIPVGPWNTDGLLVINPLFSQERKTYIQEIMKAGHPVVFVGAGQPGPTVGVDNQSGIHQAVAHLVEHGHRRIAFIAGHPDDSEGASGERLQAYREAICTCNIEADEKLIVDGFLVMDGGRTATRQLLAQNAPFTALIASNDESAIGAMQVLQEAGIRVPEDVAVIGFDDRPETLIQQPLLTSLHTHTVEQGYQAVELLLEYIEGKRQDTANIRLPVHLVVRESCGCNKNRHLYPTESHHSLDHNSLQQYLIDIIINDILKSAEFLSLHTIRSFCQEFINALFTSLTQDQPNIFQHRLDSMLKQLESKDEDVHLWQIAITHIRDNIPLLVQETDCTLTERHIEEMLNQAQSTILNAGWQQYKRYRVKQNWAVDRAGILTSQLLMALDETQIFKTLRQFLPQLGIQHTEIAFFEAKDDDPVAWSKIHRVFDVEDTPIYCSNRTFPPPELYDEPFSLALLPLVVKDEQVGFVAFDTDALEISATVVQHLATALRSVKLYREAVEAQQLAEEANRLKSRFLSTVSHELRTPLSVIVSSSELLLQESTDIKAPLPEVYSQGIQRMYASAQHLDGLIRDVIDLSHTESGQLHLTYQTLDLIDTLHPIIAVGEQMARDKGLAWHVEIPQSLPLLWGDPTRLRQVILNLISNAAKFTAQGKIILRVEEQGDQIKVMIVDTGMGISPAEQEVIFQAFRQSEQAIERGYGGMGLGLAICQRLVEMHGGHIGVQSSGQPDSGSTFYFTLPIPKDLPINVPASFNEHEQHIVLITNHLNNQNQIAPLLPQQGYHVQEVLINDPHDWSPELAKNLPSAVVIDSTLTPEQGWAILKKIKEHPDTQDIPVLFYAVELANDTGSMLTFDYLTKPIGSTQLAQALKRQVVNSDEQTPTILIVDDDPSILEVHAQMVIAQDPKYRVLKAQNGIEALTLIRQEQPNLVLLDLMMPEMDGFEVLETMQSEQIHLDIPVIVLTGQALTHEDMRRLTGSVTTVLGKGLFTVEETLNQIDEALAQVTKHSPATQQIVWYAMAYIHTHYADSVSFQELANEANISASYLTRCFHKTLGITPVVYLNRYRVNQAKRLLAKRQQSISEVAWAVGFTDTSYFSRVFRREVGMSPSDYLHKTYPPSDTIQPS